MASDIEFPICRKYKELDTWFCIHNSSHFTEIKKVGTKYVKLDVEADKYPEMLFIQDMIECLDGRWMKISNEEFARVLDQVS